MMHPSVVRGITIAALLAASLVLPTRAAADTGAAAEALAPGSWSVQFAVESDFTLGNYSGSTVSLKRHLASGNALRMGLSLSFGGDGDDFSGVTADTFATITQLGTDDSNSWSIGLNTYYLWYTGRAAPIHAYWGAGPTVSWSRRHEERSQTQIIAPSGQPPTTSLVTDDIHLRDWRVGIAGAAGVEWLVARRVGLFAEYGSSLLYASIETTRHSIISSISGTRTDDFSTDTHRWNFSGSGGRLGVSVYY